MQTELKDLNEFRTFFSQTARGFPRKAILLFEGDLGAGKTTAIQALASALGAKDLSSPTFAIIQTYAAKVPIHHVDLYRLKNDDDLDSTGFWELFLEKEGLVCIEWAQRLEIRDFPRDWPKIRFQIKKMAGDSRHIVVQTVF